MTMRKPRQQRGPTGPRHPLTPGRDVPTLPPAPTYDRSHHQEADNYSAVLWLGEMKGARVPGVPAGVHAAPVLILRAGWAR